MLAERNELVQRVLNKRNKKRKERIIQFGKSRQYLNTVGTQRIISKYTTKTKCLLRTLYNLRRKSFSPALSSQGDVSHAYLFYKTEKLILNRVSILIDEVFHATIYLSCTIGFGQWNFFPCRTIQEIGFFSHACSLMTFRYQCQCRRLDGVGVFWLAQNLNWPLGNIAAFSVVKKQLKKKERRCDLKGSKHAWDWIECKSLYNFERKITKNINQHVTEGGRNAYRLLSHLNLSKSNGFFFAS